MNTQHRNLLAGALCLLAFAAACGQDAGPRPGSLDSALLVPTPTSSRPIDSAPSGPTQAPTAQSLPTPTLFNGERSLKERIANSDIIVRASVTSVTGAVDVAGNPDIFVVYIDYRLNVHEYLRGSGPNDLIAVVWAGGHFATREEAEAEVSTYMAARNARWEDRQAIIFLSDSIFFIPRTAQASHYYLASSDSWDDRYTLASRTHKQWLPSASPDGSGGSGRARTSPAEFLLAAPQTQEGRSGGASGGTASTVTLQALNELITAVEGKLNATEGSDLYEECVRHTYELERAARYRGMDNLGMRYRGMDNLGRKPSPPHTFASGQPRNSVIWQDDEGSSYLPDVTERVWVDGGDADLFSVTLGPATRVDRDGDGTDDGLAYDRHLVADRPLPAGEYKFQFNDLGAYFAICDGFVFRFEWTVTVTAPDSAVHEAFFDPVTAGTAVKADGTNGVLEPASFTDGKSAASTLQAISYEPPAGSGNGTVKLQVDPHTGLVGHSLDFIELDGSVSLSLSVADATVDTASKTLSWSVASQPWEDGDKLMLRIRKSP